ncbi:hypothetical protein NOV72_03289 [Caballeronia novacaledonica]|uniref:Uncharacterized protein n=1 Tax=Caballeronia novacaledonica TaxID=1544861 RepID=A0A2U3I7I9_9BURK|nr:hypothetical protein [Caballeronia novacaledonica]SPB16089.1 hypothetical protein NOV72_03289 [Caballeronia novacaledonica]
MRRSWLLTWRTRRGTHALVLPRLLVLPLALVLFFVLTPVDLLVWIWRALAHHHQHDTGDTAMTGTASTIDAERDDANPLVPIWNLLLASGQGMYNDRIPDHARTTAEAVFAHLLACAAAFGFRQGDRLRALCASGRHESDDAIALAHAAVDHVPAEALRDALKRAGFPAAVTELATRANASRGDTVGGDL